MHSPPQQQKLYDLLSPAAKASLFLQDKANIRPCYAKRQSRRSLPIDSEYLWQIFFQIALFF